MAHPEFAVDEEMPRTPLLDEHEEEDLEKVFKSETSAPPSDGEATPHANRNNNAVDCSQGQTVASCSDSPLHSLETSV